MGWLRGGTGRNESRGINSRILYRDMVWQKIHGRWAATHYHG
ncbi:MAG: hypothetical protein WC586_06225 [Methanoregula sp.]